MDDQKDFINQAPDRLPITIALFYLLLFASLALWEVYLFINQKPITYLSIKNQ
jgi:hypothetical protein